MARGETAGGLTMGGAGTENRVEVTGTWWLPAKPDERIRGVATFDTTRGPVLRVAGSFSLLGERGAASADVVLGETDSGWPCSFHGALMEGERPGKESVIAGEYLFTHSALQRLSDRAFSSLHLQIDGLEQWFAIWPFRVEGPDRADGVLLRRAERRRVAVALPGKAITLADDVSAMSIGRASVSFSAAAEFSVAYDAPVSFSEALEDAISLQVLVSFFAGHVCSHRRLVLVVHGDDRHPVVVHYKSPYSWLTTEWDYDYYVALYDDVIDVFPSLLRSWWDRRQVLRIPVQQVVATMGGRALEVDFEFLALAQAIEGYHRATREGRYVSDEEYLPIADALVRAIPGKRNRRFPKQLESKDALPP